MSREPSAIIGAIFTILMLLYSWLFDGNAENQLRLMEFFEGLVPLIAALIIRSQVTPASKTR